MQPFDALTLRAVLQEAKPLLTNRRVDKIQQLGRDEILVTLRSKSGMLNLLICTRNHSGRLCLVKAMPAQNAPPAQKNQPGSTPSNFLMLLRKHLGGATLLAIEQPTGERNVDFIFSCINEIGESSRKIFTAEIMGRHSNMLLWDESTSKIITASHIVTKDMSRTREVGPGLRFVRPPEQERANFFVTSKNDFMAKFSELAEFVRSGQPLTPPFATTFEQWLINIYSGVGRTLAFEVVSQSGCSASAGGPINAEHVDLATAEKLWSVIEATQNTSLYRPALKTDLTKYTVLFHSPEGRDAHDWRDFPTVNDMVEEYYRLGEAREQFVQLRERLRSELKTELEKLENRISSAEKHAGRDVPAESLKRSGDQILANLHLIEPGQTELVCDSNFDSLNYSGSSDSSAPPDASAPAQQSNERVTIKLNPNISAAQNAQAFYRQFAKTRGRQRAADLVSQEAESRLKLVNDQMEILNSATDPAPLYRVKEWLQGRKPQEAINKQQPQSQGQKKSSSRLLSTTSSDGWTIYVGRNRQENDYLLTKLAKPFDLWLHIQGQGGAHVLVRVPASKQDPPMTTLKEAATVAARLSKSTSGGKVRVVYTQCRYVRKIANEKAGVVRYENERTIEIDTAAPMPNCMKQLFQR